MKKKKKKKKRKINKNKRTCKIKPFILSSCQQETLHGFCRPGEGIWSSTSEGHLVGAEKTWCGRVDCATGAGDVCKCAEPCPCWWGVQWRVQSEGRCSPRLSTQPAALHPAWSMRVPLWGPLEGPLCRWPCYHRWKNVSGGSWLRKKQWKWKDWNTGKMKIMTCGMGLDLLQSSGKFSCAFCHTGVGSNFFCNGCKHWVHKKSSGLKTLTKDPGYRCTRCQGTARSLNGRQQKEVQAGPDKPEVVASFCYLGNMLSAAGSCELSTTPRVKTTWKRWPCLQLLCGECNASCQWDLAIDKAKPPASAAEWQGNDQTDLQCEATRHCHH